MANTTNNNSTTMGLQAHPCSNKRTIEGLEEPAGRAQHHYNQQQSLHHQAGPRAAKQQCTIRVGVEAPDHLASPLVPASSELVNNNWYHRDQQQQQQQPSTPDYETYVNGFNAAQVRASTPYSSSSVSASYGTYTSSSAAENGPVPAVAEYSSASSSYNNNNNNSANSSVAAEVYSSQNVYQNLTSMLPVANGGGESLADRFERVCSSPRPFVQQYNSREEPNAGYHYGGGNNETAAAAANERYWTFGYTSHCPKKTTGYVPKSSNNYGYAGEFATKPNGYQQQQQQQLAGQTIQRDENGKSYLELGAKAAVQPVHEWVRPAQTWPAQQQQQQQHYAPVKSCCSKCGHVLPPPTRSLLPPQPCYRHQRLSVLSLSMLKLNRYRQCSDPSLHRSVLICNTLRHIEDEMEREGLACNPSTETSSSANCDTCCCSHCGTVFSNNNAAAAAAAKQTDNTPVAYTNNSSSTPPPAPPAPSNTTATTNNSSSAVFDSTPDGNFGGCNGGDYKSTTSVANADEDDSGFGDEDSRDIDWSSVFSMSTTSGFDVSGSSNSSANSSSSDSYLCDSNSSDPSLFAAGPAELVNELGPNWKSNSSHCGSTSGGSSWTSDASDFSGVRWKNELGDELEGFVHILVGSS